MTETLRKHNPATGALLAEIPRTATAAVEAHVARARLAQRAWGALSPKQRGVALQRLAAVVARSSDRLAQLVSDETGKPLAESLVNEVFAAARAANYFGRHAARILRPQKVPLSFFVHRRSYLHYVPRGVVGIITPWNFPLTIAFGELAMSLCAGNAVVLKPSEHTPLTALALPRCLEEAGIDPELLQVLVGEGDVGAALVRSSIDMLMFTGSVPTGRKIAAVAGERLLPCVLELGGKDAALVLEDADIEHAARTLVFGAFANAGQACASVERVYAVGEAYEPLVARLVQLVGDLRQGDGSSGQDLDVGPMITPGQLTIVQEQVTAATAAGATVRVGGQAHGPYFAPTLLTEVDDHMAVCRDETFGPVLPVMRVQSVDEAVRRANDSIYGLSAYVFTRNARRGREVAERLQAGTVDVNDVLFTHAAPETPWGGVKMSGIGHTHADSGVRQLCEARHVNYSPLPPFSNWWIFPYKRQTIEPAVNLMRGLYGQLPLWQRLKLTLRGSLGILRIIFASDPRP